ncbi:MAG: peptidoglycan DD-metalloendopeptidase family protein [Emcibacter sp.]|nr:peptidoglycan DD-metalloendopeptidase family protein [Emcibacter sp.]
MKIYNLLLKITVILGVSGILSACQEGHSFSTRYEHAIPVKHYAKNTPYPIPTPRDKPIRKKITTTKIQIFPDNPSKNPLTIHVRKGDTIYALSRRHKVTVREIILTNKLKPPYLLYPGQKLKSPAMAVHIVKKGDTVYSLSRKYNEDMTIFTRLNNIKKPYALTIGQKLKVPGKIHPNFQGGNKKKANANHPPPPQSGQGFMWPVKGRILSSFGPKATGYHNDGINIAATSGSYVRSAQNGVVVYTGNKIKGFGKLILIRHSEGWITAYAHNSAILVTKGQTVKRGQSIARVGQSGGVNRPQLHFEMRRATRAVNPVRYLKG